MLLSSLLFYYEIFLWFSKKTCICFPQMIDPWSTLNYPGLLLLIVDWFTSLVTNLLLPLTQYLVYCCHHWSYGIKSSSDFRNFFFHLHSKIDKTLINPQLPWSSVVDCWLICIAHPIYIAPTDPVPGLLFLLLVFCYQIFLWFPKFLLALALHNWYTPDQSSITLVFCCRL